MHNPECVLENGKYKILRNFEIQKDHIISARRPDLVIVNNEKENKPNSGLCCPDRLLSKNKTKREIST